MIERPVIGSHIKYSLLDSIGMVPVIPNIVSINPKTPKRVLFFLAICDTFLWAQGFILVLITEILKDFYSLHCFFPDD
jgi:hypothetical protein